MIFSRKYFLVVLGVFVLSAFLTTTSSMFAQSITWKLWFTPQSITATTPERIAVLAWDIPTGMSGVIVCNGIVAYDAFSAPSSSAKSLTFGDTASGTRTCTLRDAADPATAIKGTATVTVDARAGGGVCTGIPPSSILCPGDNAGFTGNVASTVVADAASCGAPKCEYYCDATHEKSGNTCVATSGGASCSGSYGALTDQKGTCLATPGATSCPSSEEVKIDASVSGGTPCPTGVLCCGTVAVTPTDPTTPAGAACSGSNPGIVPCGRSCDDPATTDINETGICTLCHIFLLIKNITSWIFMVMTYIAFAVLVAMGILYIVSAGNTQMITLAKGGIKAALSGFAIVLLGWVAINVILMVLADGALGTGTAAFSFKTNGSWFEYKCDATSKYVRSGIGGTGGGGGGGGGGGSGGNLNCKDGKCAKMQDVANAAKNNKSSVESDIVMAIIDAGEGCNKSLSSDGYGSCGYSQALPAIRAKCGITGSASESCAKVQNNVQLDLDCAAWLIKDNAGRCGMDIRNVASCYNSGKPNNCAKTTNKYCDRVETYYQSCKAQ